MAKPKVLILRAPGTNCNEETAYAWELAGAHCETWHLSRLLADTSHIAQFQILTIPGGFSYGDDLGAGRIFATRLGSCLGDEVQRLRDRGGLILGICNGFQVLVRAGLLPGNLDGGSVTLTRNDSGHFEDRWTRLVPRPGRTPFLATNEPLELPAAHGEGKFLTRSPADLEQLDASGQIVLRYVDEQGEPTQQFPHNPNGSLGAVAGICDPTGQILGLMPHPERHALPYHHPRWTRSELRPEGDGMRLFRSAVASLSS